MTDEHFFSQDSVTSILKKIEELHHLNDLDTILDRILFESRKFTKADAGSIFLVDNNKLVFSYVQNDSLFKRDEAHVCQFKNFSIPIDNRSLVGYSAQTGQKIVIDDAYHLPSGLPCTFDSSFDEKSGYRTQSLFTMPLIISEVRLVGVMQLINARNRHGETIPFEKEGLLCVPHFASHAAVAIERGILNRQLMLRMMKMAELRDPSETTSHVQRVGAYSAEIYHRWALNKKYDIKEIKTNKDLIRLAAMLHDVGKVGIPDQILKKPGRLTHEEFELLKLHTVYGVNLFETTTSELDVLTRNIVLNHHQKWDGSGYPDPALIGRMGHDGVMQGNRIPLAARITALADVYDALSSRRCYKEAWPRDKVHDCIKDGAGSHFDPEVVDAFFQITDVIEAIGEKYRDTAMIEKNSLELINLDSDLHRRKRLFCGNSQETFWEISHIMSLAMPDFDLSFIKQVYDDVIDLFEGRYPGYRASNTWYHDLTHTLSVTLALVRLSHGASVSGQPFSAEVFEQGIIAALFHDTGFIMEITDTEGTGAKHSIGHEERSISLMHSYLLRHGRSAIFYEGCVQMIKCTNLSLSPVDISFFSAEVRRMGFVLGSADLLAQMADRLYLEKLPLLFQEFQEGDVPGYETGLDIFRKTEEFYRKSIMERLFTTFDGITNNMRFHFRERWKIDKNLYLEAITRNIDYVSYLNSKCTTNIKCYLENLRRKA